MKTKAVSACISSPVNINTIHCLLFAFYVYLYCFSCKLWDIGWELVSSYFRKTVLCILCPVQSVFNNQPTTFTED